MRRTILLTLTVLVLAACGDDNFGGIPGGGGDIDIPGGSIDVDFDPTDGGIPNVSFETDEGSLQTGNNLPPPSWLPSGFYLPAGLNIQNIVEDTVNGSNGLYGSVAGGNATEIQAEAVATLQGQGYELLDESEGYALFARDGVGLVSITTTAFGLTGAQDEATFFAEIETGADLDEARARYAEAVVGAGMATATIGDVTYETSGECNIQGNFYAFYGDDGGINLTIDFGAEPLFVDATVVNYGVSPPYFFSMNSFTGSSGDIEVDSSDNSFSASGLWVDGTGESDTPVAGTVTASC